MAKTRKKTAKKTAKKATTVAPPRPRGRPTAIKNRRMSVGIFVRCTPEQKEAIEKHVAKISKGREKSGLGKLDLSTWVREAALKLSGNEDLGAAGEARKALEAAASIV